MNQQRRRRRVLRTAFLATLASTVVAGGLGLAPSGTTSTSPARADAPADWVREDAAKRMRMTIQAEELDATVTDFPVMVRLSPETFDYASAQQKHLVFVAGTDDTPLPYEVESWNPTGESVVWVRVPEVGPSARTVDLYYDGTSSSTVSSAEVWDESFAAVHHFEETEGMLADSTANGNDAQTAGGPTYAEPGRTGPALAFDGVDDYADMGDAAAQVPQMTASASVYVDPASLTRSWAVFAGRDASGGQHPGEQFVLGLNNGRWLTRYVVDGQIHSGPAAEATEGWHNLTTTYDGEIIKVYVDGAFLGEVDAPGNLDSGEAIPLVLGAYASHDLWMKFSFDEFRISDVARDTAWIQAEELARNNQILTALPTQSQDGSVVLSVNTPREGTEVNGSTLTLTGSVSVPSTISYRLDDAEPVSLGEVDSQFTADLTDLTSGTHTLEVTARVDEDNSDTETVTFNVDASPPEVTFNSPTDGTTYRKESFVVDVSAADANGVESLELALDGEPVENGQRLVPDDLTDGQHTLIATATDGIGNVGETSITFRTAGNYPNVPSDPEPADGAVDVNPADAELSVTVSDPAGDPLDVVFRRAYRSDFTNSGATGTQGSSMEARPARTAGDAVTDTSALEAADGDELTTSSTGAYPFQQFELAVPDDLAAQRMTVNWSGEVPQGQRAALSAWNYETRSWQLVADGEGGQALELSGEVSVGETVRNGAVRVMVQDVSASVVDDDDTATFAWLTDTQFYSEREPATYQEMVDWVVENRETEDIGYGIHTGDIVQNPNNGTEWARASRIMRTWDDAGFPYGVVPGNHDIANGQYEVYRSHFGERRFADNAWYGGTVDDNVQHYDLLSTPKAEYLVMYLDWSISQEEIDWANEVIQDHPEHNVIIATHQYLAVGGGFYGPGERIFNEIVVPNQNVDLILCGHIHGVAMNVKRLEDDRVVVEILQDYQSLPTAGGGWMRTMQLDATDQTVSNETFSVLTDGDNGLGDPEQENFTVPLEIETPNRLVSTDYVGITARTTDVIGRADGVPSNTTVTVDAGKLEPDITYPWYVQATDADGFRSVSPIWEFTTGRVATEVRTEEIRVRPRRPVELSADVLPVEATGTVRFTVTDAVPEVSCEAALDGEEGEATCALPGGRNALPRGTYQVEAAYAGDDAHAPSAGSFTLQAGYRGPWWPRPRGPLGSPLRSALPR